MAGEQGLLGILDEAQAPEYAIREPVKSCTQPRKTGRPISGCPGFRMYLYPRHVEKRSASECLVLAVLFISWVRDTFQILPSSGTPDERLTTILGLDNLKQFTPAVFDPVESVLGQLMRPLRYRDA